MSEKRGKGKKTKKKGSNKGRPAAPKKGKRRTPGISTATYNKLWDAYRERQSIDYCAKKAGVNPKTAEKYIDGDGAPEFMMHPIAVRYARVMQAAQEEEEITLSGFRRDMLNDVVLPTMKLLETERVLGSQDAVKRLTDYKKTKKIKTRVGVEALTRAQDRMVRLGERMLGGADIKVEQGGTLEDKFRGWTEKELVEYATSGKMPDHAK